MESSRYGRGYVMDKSEKTTKQRCKWYQSNSVSHMDGFEPKFKPSCNYTGEYAVWSGQMYCPFCGLQIEFK